MPNLSIYLPTEQFELLGHLAKGTGRKPGKLASEIVLELLTAPEVAHDLTPGNRPTDTGVNVLNVLRARQGGTTEDVAIALGIPPARVFLSLLDLTRRRAVTVTNVNVLSFRAYRWQPLTGVE